MESEKKEEEEKLVWRRCNNDSLLMQSFDEMLGLLSYVADTSIKDAEKELKNLKRFK